ncbi:hypothetical protein N9558_01475 [Porticoccaceae bacterium]|jgi:uncharacterized protein YqgV (UPF0045/DUF77 family)|nr:hypothetical protein [Porticoccaceae bacterium]MDB4109059.1 hypothetical protein [Porticoccaceae bacterium]MDB9843814.1 hypothetical protein [Porticoccaceae bacterium]CAI8366816.1 MAG: Uncharacterised protein [SAR92 bacterium MED-G29]|tara:strand:+ start:4390 stop:4638 length:249 start_codon:yes stop_codon:yes gene_type:complete
MQVTIDISMYPNREDFIPPIEGFIEKINKFDNLKVTTFPTSTVVQGNFDQAMSAVQDTVAECYREFNMAIYVAKIIPGYEAL